MRGDLRTVLAALKLKDAECKAWRAERDASYSFSGHEDFYERTSALAVERHDAEAAVDAFEAGDSEKGRETT
jgi:hypothetical protein